MNDEMTMRIGNRRADFAKEFQPFDQRKARARCNTSSMGSPSTYSMTKYGRPLSVVSAVKEPRNIWVIEAGEDLPLIPEMPQDRIGVRAAFD